MARTKKNEAEVVKANIESTNTDIEVKKVDIEIDNNDEFEVEALVPNVSYKDKTSEDIYEWEKAGDIVTLPFFAIKNIWRNHKSYFKGLYLRVLDKNVVKKLNISDTYETYKMFYEAENYKTSNIKELIEKIEKAPAEIRDSLCLKVKTFITDGDVTDINVIKALDVFFDADLLALA